MTQHFILHYIETLDLAVWRCAREFAPILCLSLSSYSFHRPYIKISHDWGRIVNITTLLCTPKGHSRYHTMLPIRWMLCWCPWTIL